MKLQKTLSFLAVGVCVAWAGLFSTSTNASVVIGGTRAIYQASDAEITLRLTNEGKAPALVQSWVDDGDAQSAPSDIVVPFTITPPIARIEPNKAQTLRIVHTGEALPKDRESVFWINVLEIPPKPGEAYSDANLIQLAFRSRIKLFYRPADLQGSATDAPAQLVWRLTHADAKPAIKAHNPTSFHVSLTEVRVEAAGGSARNGSGGMVAPGESYTFELDGNLSSAVNANVHYTALSDHGGAISNKAAVVSGSAAR